MTTPPRDRRPGRQERIDASLAWLDRYRPLLDDERAFREALEPPAPVDLLVHTGRLAAGELAARLAARGLGVTRLPWAPSHLRIRGHAGAGTLPEVVFGWAFPQGAASAVPPQALAPRAGERIADLCAAPGGKTALAALLAGESARIVAGEVSAGRCGLLVSNLSRLALTSVIIAQQDAASFPRGASCDAVLLDAPCTGEGTFRVASPRYEPLGEAGLARARALQKRILARAIELLAPGGRLVYATCSYAPEENEEVLAGALAENAELELLPLPAATPGLPGIASWQGASFPASLRHARRMLPHHTGSWGFFVALLARAPRPDTDAAPCPAPGPAAGEDADARQLLLDYYRERFGVDASAFDGHLVRQRGRDLWLLSRPPRGTEPGLERLRVVAPGLRALHGTNAGPRTTNAALRWLGSRIRERRLELDGAQTPALLGPEGCPAPAGLAGLVAVAVEGQVVGAGHAHAGRVTLELPAAWR
ncbi:MAG: RsmB/NOP family class I SAM-dependent RNA methyltransferase [Acidobacteria bacterium]|nr:RsmB/NOP family class I SAM-dependent RNA methyltransferase [Acidobacteriota bacterium]